MVEAIIVLIYAIPKVVSAQIQTTPHNKVMRGRLLQGA